MKTQIPLFFFLNLLWLAACQPSEIAAEIKPTPSSSFETLTLEPPSLTPNTPDPANEELVQQARSQLAKKLNLQEDEIFVFSTEAVEWPDASLGCPQPGIAYAQALTPGYRITLESGGQVYTFHTDEKEQVILCTARGPDEIYLPP